MKPLERVTPGTKVYKLFDSEKWICEGKDDVFIISVEKLSKEEYQRKQQEVAAR
ncbi:MAG: hypothetical protein H0Z34_03090 [Brevibacillus sp.]|nr:hypothetical protein [Brevibacillus sp.]